jgi:ribosomal protein S1
LHFSAIQVGEIHNAEVVVIRSLGLQLRIGKSVTAFCPPNLTSDVGTTDAGKLAKKFKVGQKLRVRVWKKDNYLQVTVKKSILELDASKCVFNYDDARVGLQTIGSIKEIKSEGITVQFFNKVGSELLYDLNDDGQA